MQVVPYIRFSTVKQEAGSSIERQSEAVYGMISRMGWTAGTAVEDLGKSAWKGDHIRTGNLGRWAESVRRGEVPPGTILVVEKMDRLSRQGHHVVEAWIDEMITLGMAIAFADENKVINATNRRELGDLITRLVKAEGAREYVANLRSNVIRGIRKNQSRRQETGTPDSKIHPKWLAYDDNGILRPIPERAEAVVQIYAWAADGQGALTIAQRLNEGGFRCWTAKHWKTTTVRHLLRHPSVNGSFQQMEDGKPFGDLMPNYYPAILDNDLIARARAQLGSRKWLAGKPTPERFVNVFQGMARCAQCMGRMHVQKAKDQKSGKVYRSFRCEAAAHKAGCDRSVTFRYYDLETAVLDRILHLAMDDRFFSRPDATKGLAITVADLERTLEMDRSKSERLLELMLNGDPDPIMVQMRSKLTASISANEKALMTARRELEAAQGAVDPAAHLERVREVRSAMSDPNPNVRAAASDMVATAMANVVSSVMFESEGKKRQATKIITVIIAGGIAAMRFDNEGHLIDQVNLAPGLDDQLRSGVVGSNQMWNANLDNILRRAAA